MMNKAIMNLAFTLESLKEDAFNNYDKKVYDFCNDVLQKLEILIDEEHICVECLPIDM